MTPAAELDSLLCRLAIWREARGESKAAKAAVLAVIRNRAADGKGRWPKTLAGVVTQPAQFSSFNATDHNVTLWPTPLHPADWQAWLDACEVFDTPLIADPTNGSNFYHDASIPPPAEQWLGKGKTVADLEALKTCQVGKLSFYRIP